MGFFDRISGAITNSIAKLGVNSKISILKNTISKYDSKDNSFEYESNRNLALTPQLKTNPAVDDSVIYVPIDRSYVRFIKSYLNKKVIENAIEKNPNIKAILNEHNLDINYNLNNVASIMMSHLIPCAKVAQKIYKNLGHSEAELEYTYLTQAALLHDIGKVFIPAEILNKNGKLTRAEREIVELHNKLSYEILITTDLGSKVARLTFEHHNYDGNVHKNPENQTLTIADVYCALRENRPYKKALSDLRAKTILYDMGTKGKFDARYINYIN